MRAPGLPGRRRGRRPRPARPADPGLHGRRRLVGAHDPGGCGAPATTPAGPASALNVGCSARGVERLEERLEALVQRQGQRAAVIGQSRGGSFAKVLAQLRPDLVAGIVTLGSPTLDPLNVHPLVRGGVEAVASAGRAGRTRPLPPRLPSAATAARASGSCTTVRCRATSASPPSTRAATASSTGARAWTRPREARRDPLEPLRHGRAPRRLRRHRGRAQELPAPRLEARR